MKTKILTLLIVIIFASSCIVVESPEKIETEEPEEEIQEEQPEEEQVEEIQEIENQTVSNQYKLVYGETINVDGMAVKVNKFDTNAHLLLDIDGQIKELKETKTKEIYFNHYFSMIDYHYTGNSQTNYVILEITPLNLEENQYLLYKGVILKNKLGKDIKLEEVQPDGYIRVTVCDTGTVLCEQFVNIYKGKTEEVFGLNVKNINHYWKVTQYALIEISLAN